MNARWLLSLAIAAGCCPAAPTAPPSSLAESVPKPASPSPEPTAATSFERDLAFLREHASVDGQGVVVLEEPGGAGRVVVAPSYQGRVMTSAAARGESFGWIHRDNLRAGKRQPHMTVVGGEDRFWLGPEGGPFGLYFAPGDPYDLEHWQVPEAIDWGAWPVTEQTASSIGFHKAMTLTNHAGTRLSLEVERTVRVLTPGDFGFPAGIDAVCYTSVNQITNTGEEAWTKEGGLVSIWILGMFNPSPSTTVVVPFVVGAEEELGPVMNDAYFGPVPADRLKVVEGVVLFRGDGRQRGKIGIPRPRAKAELGAYDAEAGVLTLVRYDLPSDATDYVDSMWEDQAEPYAGDVVNSYNDGPPAPGKPPLGPFYELETSSPAAALAPGASLSHRHQTCHLQGSPEDLDPVARARLGVGLDVIATAFAQGPP